MWFPYHLLKALANFDWPFFVGFFWAAIQVPVLIYNNPPLVKKYPINAKEVIKKFAK